MDLHGRVCDGLDLRAGHVLALFERLAKPLGFDLPVLAIKLHNLNSLAHEIVTVELSDALNDMSKTDTGTYNNSSKT